VADKERASLEVSGKFERGRERERERDERERVRVLEIEIESEGQRQRESVPYHRCGTLSPLAQPDSLRTRFRFVSDPATFGPTPTKVGRDSARLSVPPSTRPSPAVRPGRT
jgi:hypothetical protein